MIMMSLVGWLVDDHHHQNSETFFLETSKRKKGNSFDYGNIIDTDQFEKKRKNITTL